MASEADGRPRDDLPVIAPRSAAEWRLWLEAEHDSALGAWLKLARKGTAGFSLDYAGAVDVALCYGWIDGQKAPLDGSSWLQRFTPRGPRSRWSQVNRDRVAALEAAGLMRPSGQAAVEAARQDGRWEAAYAPQRAATVPDDLRAALDVNPVAAEFFATLRGANRYAVLYRIASVKRPETRARKITQYVEMLAQQRTLH